MPTIQHLVSRARLITELNAALNLTGLDARQVVIWAQIQAEGLDLVDQINALGLEVGAGLFPNTFTLDGAYKYVHNAREETALLIAGWRPATFPERMVRAGSPDIIAENALQKYELLLVGYTLPGLPPPPSVDGAAGA